MGAIHRLNIKNTSLNIRRTPRYSGWWIEAKTYDYFWRSKAKSQSNFRWHLQHLQGWALHKFIEIPLSYLQSHIVLISPANVLIKLYIRHTKPTLRLNCGCRLCSYQIWVGNFFQISIRHFVIEMFKIATRNTQLPLIFANVFIRHVIYTFTRM